MKDVRLVSMLLDSPYSQEDWYCYMKDFRPIGANSLVAQLAPLGVSKRDVQGSNPPPPPQHHYNYRIIKKIKNKTKKEVIQTY